MKAKKHILIVDDVTTNLKCLGEMLRKDYSLTLAKSGEKALEIMEKIHPDLVLMDVKMPGMDGYQTFSIMKSDPNMSDVPVVFLTADTDNESEVRGLKLGACDFIKKPFEPDVMKERIERVLSQEEFNKDLMNFVYRDNLTNVWNRLYLVKYLERLDPKNEFGSFLILDLDNFKGINDTYGHLVGDNALEAFARTLESFIHKDDVVARIGGDEFAVYLRNCHETEALKKRIDDLIREVEIKLSIVKEDERINSVSVGVSSFPKDGSEFLELYMKADKAMYYVKRNGKSGCHFYSDSDIYDISTDSHGSVGDVEEFKARMDDASSEAGPLNCDYDNFLSVYSFIRRYSLRNDNSVQILLFTIKDLELIDSDNAKGIAEGMSLLEECIKDSLRKNDVSTRYSGTQYLVILMDVDKEHRQIVVNRILNSWNQKNSNSSIMLKYDIQKM